MSVKPRPVKAPRSYGTGGNTPNHDHRGESAHTHEDLYTSVVVYNGGPPHAVCLCRWKGPDRPSWEDARLDAARHRKGHS